MKLVKSLLLGTAAGLAAVAGAQAADLPFRKAAPVDYVRVCDWTKDAGYFYIPGTDTCLRIGGEARFEYAYVDPKASFSPTPFATLAGSKGVYTPSKQKSSSGFFARLQIETDVRTQTAYGLLRAFVRVRGDRDAGNYNTGSLAPGFGGSSTTVSVEKAFIEFAGFTAGRHTSFFDFYDDNYNYEGIATSDEAATVLAYTATFGGGFSATIAVQNPGDAYRDGIGTIAFGNTAVGAAANTAVPPINGVGVGYAGVEYPDVIGVLNYDNDSWGGVQLAAAYHDVNTVSSAAVVGTTGFSSSTKAGFAVEAGVHIKLPMIAAGDELYLQGIYEEGGYLFQDSSTGLNNGFYGLNIGGFIHNDVDAVAVGNTGTNGYHLELAKGFSVLGVFQHYFTPQFHDILYGSYEEIGYGNQVKNIDWSRGGIGDGSEYRIGNQFIFTPVHNFDIGVDVMYAKINQTLAHEVGLPASALPAGIAVNPDSFQVRLRLNRDF